MQKIVIPFYKLQVEFFAKFIIVSARVRVYNRTVPCSGGFAADNSTKEFESEFVLDHNPEMDEEIRFAFSLADLLSIAKMNPDASEIRKAIVTIKDDAYTFVGVDLEFEK